MSYHSKSDQKWEENYKDGDIVYVPYNDIFSSIFPYYGTNIKSLKLLEIGCGTGNNLLFAGLRLGLKTTGIGISESAVNYTKDLF